MPSGSPRTGRLQPAASASRRPRPPGLLRPHAICIARANRWGSPPAGDPPPTPRARPARSAQGPGPRPPPVPL